MKKIRLDYEESAGSNSQTVGRILKGLMRNKRPGVLNTETAERKPFDIRTGGMSINQTG